MSEDSGQPIETNMADPLTPIPDSDADLALEVSPRTLRVLRYLERRRMRNVRITKRVRWEEGELEEIDEQAAVQVSLHPTRSLSNGNDTPTPIPIPDPITPVPDSGVVAMTTVGIDGEVAPPLPGGAINLAPTDGDGSSPAVLAREESLRSEIVASPETPVELSVSQTQSGESFAEPMEMGRSVTESSTKNRRLWILHQGATQASPPHSTPPPPLRDQIALSPIPGGAVAEPTVVGQPVAEPVQQVEQPQQVGRPVVEPMETGQTLQVGQTVAEPTVAGRPQPGRPQGSPLLYTDEMLRISGRGGYARYLGLLADARRKRFRRKILVRRFVRKHLRTVRARERRERRRMWITIANVVLALLIVFLSIGSAAAYVTYHFVGTTQRAFEHQLLTLHDLLPADNLKMYDSRGVLIDQLTDNGVHTTVTFDQVASIMREATVATEDKNFWYNQGIDVLGIIRAFLTNLEKGRVVEGGSTITQQLIKNLIVGNQPTIVRKLEEIVLAPQVNNDYTKSDILTMYLNSIYYGHQAYGVDAAATVYFGLEDRPGRSAASQLDLAQSAMLAGLPSNPSQFDPAVHPRAAAQRFETVLNLMVSQRYISTVDKYDAIREEQSPNFFKTGASLKNRAPHFANFVLTQLQKLFHMQNRGDLSRSNMIVYTTLDIGLQDKIQRIMQQHIAELRDAHHLTNAAEVLIDFHSGAIISLLGSIDYNNASIDGQYDVTLAYRQPGSSFKPYVYVTAFEQGTSPAQAIDDKRTTIPVPDSNPPTFTPTNYDLKFHGHMTLRCALQNSLNVPGVKVLQHVGIDEAMQTAYNMGITSYQGTPGYSLVLGGLGIRLIDHTSAMGVFANGGVRVPDYSINKVVSGSTGKVLYQHQLDPGKQVITPQLAYMMTNVLSDNTDRLPEFYDCNVLQLYANSQQDCWNGNRGVVRPAAAKTGTTNDFRDNWTVGYTTDYVMGVWAGNDDNSPMIDVSGITGAAPIWHDSMLLAEQGHPIQDFTNPGGLVRATVTYPDGVKTSDWFLPGTVPTFSEKPGPTSTPGDTPTPEPGGGNPAGPLPAPYCPASYSFAFAPPPDNVRPPDPGWW